MNLADSSRRPGAPHNPGVRDLVAGKRRWSAAPSAAQARQGFRGWNERGFLPHRDEPGLVQFVSFRLADSFPAALRAEWAHLLEIEDARDRRTELEAYLDRGRGDCVLRQPRVAEWVETALRFFHGQRYDLRAWVVMPNHVHALFKVDAVPLSELVESWKKYTAQKANRMLGRRGSLWETDYWDTYMRNAAHETQTVRYIENNPTKARLVKEPRDWPWSSARLRDAAGRLCL